MKEMSFFLKKRKLNKGTIYILLFRSDKTFLEKLKKLASLNKL